MKRVLICLAIFGIFLVAFGPLPEALDFVLPKPSADIAIWTRNCRDQLGTKRHVQFHEQTLVPEQPSWWVVCDHQNESGFFYNVWEQSCWTYRVRVTYITVDWARASCMAP